jgi:uncharacterized protein YbjT (DUF2867 family)
LSIVGIDDLPESGYYRAKVAQEKLVKEASTPYTIVRSTQFFEFIDRIADEATDSDTVHIAPALVQPIAADDLADLISEVAVEPAVNGTVEVAGPRPYPLDELIRTVLNGRNDPRKVVGDSGARFFGTRLERQSLVPHDGGARLAPTTLDQWLRKKSG